MSKDTKVLLIIGAVGAVGVLVLIIALGLTTPKDSLSTDGNQKVIKLTYKITVPGLDRTLFCDDIDLGYNGTKCHRGDESIIIRGTAVIENINRTDTLKTNNHE